jgi:hypothetical protein
MPQDSQGYHSLEFIPAVTLLPGKGEYFENVNPWSIVTDEGCAGGDFSAVID